MPTNICKTYTWFCNSCHFFQCIGLGMANSGTTNGDWCTIRIISYASGILWLYASTYQFLYTFFCPAFANNKNVNVRISEFMKLQPSFPVPPPTSRICASLSKLCFSRVSENFLTDWSSASNLYFSCPTTARASK